MAINLYKVILDSISLTFQYDILVDVLFELKKAIRRVTETAWGTAVNGKPNEPIWDVVIETSEELYGAAFVTCQASITAVVSQIIRFHAFLNKNGIALTSLPSTRTQLLRSMSAKISSTDITYVLAIETFANYYKHNDEWPVGWTNPTERSKITIDNLKALGITDNTNGVLIKAMEFFDSNLLGLANAINDWHTRIVSELKLELLEKKLI